MTAWQRPVPSDRELPAETTVAVEDGLVDAVTSGEVADPTGPASSGPMIVDPLLIVAEHPDATKWKFDTIPAYVGTLGRIP